MSEYKFTNNWFEITARKVWDQMIPKLNPTKILEIGSFEGASVCYLINNLAKSHSIEVHCVDTWEGGIEHQQNGLAEANMGDVYSRFVNNTNHAIKTSPCKVDLRIHKGRSDLQLSKLLSQGKSDYFDFIYVDGSHEAPDVLSDAILGFRLLKVGGIIAFDDYLWAENLPEGKDLLRCPKPAIDSFTNIYCRKLAIIPAHLYQLYVRKTSN
jgi:predicted O-methyltransferase YrrM